jgi:hypothetical protein
VRAGNKWRKSRSDGEEAGQGQKLKRVK